MAEPSQQPADPLMLWREWAQQSEEQWNQYFNQIMGSEAFAATMGRGMEAFLALQERLTQQFEAMLKAWNLPTRADITSLGERLTEIEERLDRLTALIQQGERGERGQGSPRRSSAAKASPVSPPRS